MSSPGFTGGMGPSDLYGRAINFSGRSITLPSNMNNNNNNNNNFSTNNNNTQNFVNPLYRPQQNQLSAMFMDSPSQIPQNRSSNLIREYLDPSSQIAQRQVSNLVGKRTLAEYQTHNNLNNNRIHTHNSANAYLSNLVLRSVKPRNFLYGSPLSPHSPMDFSNSPSDSSSSTSAIAMLLRSTPIAQNSNSTPFNNSNSLLQNQNQDSSFADMHASLTDPQKKIMDDCLLEMEKHLLEDSDEEGEQNVNSGIAANSEWSETIQNLIHFEPNPNPNPNPIQIPVSSPSSSNNSSSSSSVSPAAFSSKQSLMEVAKAISEGNIDAAAEIINRLLKTLNPVDPVNPSLNSDARLTCCMISAMKSRLNYVDSLPPVAELFSKEHAESTQVLFANCLCFKVAFMAANVAIVEAAFDELTAATENTNNSMMMNLCVVDFDIGHGERYINLMQELHARLRGSGAVLKITAVVDDIYDERLKTVGENLSLQAGRSGIGFVFKVVSLKISELTRESLGFNSEDILAVNFAFKLFRMADESVSTENPRDELLRRVKSLSPCVVTLLEQEMHANTAPFVTRVAESFSYYGALLDSIESTLGKESLDRVKIEEGLSRKLINTVACEGTDRVERCEVFGKWRARMSMAGFRLNPVSQKVAESVKARLAPGSRVNVNEENGGVCFGWMGRTLTVASAWR